MKCGRGKPLVLMGEYLMQVDEDEDVIVDADGAAEDVLIVLAMVGCGSFMY